MARERFKDLEDLGGAAAGQARGPQGGRSAAAAAVPGLKRRKSGAQLRREKKERERAAAGVEEATPRVPGDAGPQPGGGDAPPVASPPPAPAKKPAGEERPEDLTLAKKVLNDPDLLEFLEGLYAAPFEAWAAAVQVPEVVPAPAKVKRAARLIKQVMILFGPKEWMKYLPLVFLVLALGEDLVHGVAAMKEAKEKKEAEIHRRKPAPPPAPMPPVTRSELPEFPAPGAPPA